MDEKKFMEQAKSKTDMEVSSEIGNVNNQSDKNNDTSSDDLYKLLPLTP
ncbi:MAG: hypothetical protein AWM53_00389 [Candidatus Dichloromethanomonas elyunquensis]|nr:MAG: hypothetical protein AWM53_00389 [Candidatus Dichloromethanomonas elyunquensis]